VQCFFSNSNSANKKTWSPLGNISIQCNEGGDIRYVGFEEDTGIVTVQLAGSCVGCPSSSVTLKNGVENMLMHYIPEVTSVISLDEDEEDESEGGDEVVVEQNSGDKKIKTYEERLAAAGIPFSD